MSHLAANSQISRRVAFRGHFKVNLRRLDNALVLSVKTLSRCLLHLDAQIWKTKRIASTSWTLMLGSSEFLFALLLAERAFPCTKAQNASD